MSAHSHSSSNRTGEVMEISFIIGQNNKEKALMNYKKLTFYLHLRILSRLGAMVADEIFRPVCFFLPNVLANDYQL